MIATIFSNPIFIGTGAGVLTSVSMLPQLIKMIREKKAQDISIGMLILLFCGLGLWIYYGFVKKDLPLIITNLFSLLMNVVMIFLSVKFKRKAGKLKVKS